MTVYFFDIFIVFFLCYKQLLMMTTCLSFVFFFCNCLWGGWFQDNEKNYPGALIPLLHFTTFLKVAILELLWWGVLCPECFLLSCVKLEFAMSKMLNRIWGMLYNIVRLCLIYDQLEIYLIYKYLMHPECMWCPISGSVPIYLRGNVILGIIRYICLLMQISYALTVNKFVFFPFYTWNLWYTQFFFFSLSTYSNDCCWYLQLLI